MPKEKEIKAVKESNRDEERIHFGKKTFICFACGQKINEETKTCPNCGTKQANLYYRFK